MRLFRYARQACLKEVGERGQARIRESQAYVAARGFEAAIEARYLVGAGVVHLVAKDPSIAAAAHALDRLAEVSHADLPAREERSQPAIEGMHDDTARAFARGAMRALSHLRSVLTDEHLEAR